MAKSQKKLSLAQKAVAKNERQKKYMTVFIHGKQVRVKRPVLIGGMDIDEFILRNANPICLHQNEMWEYIQEQECQSEEENKPLNVKKNTDLPF